MICLATGNTKKTDMAEFLENDIIWKEKEGVFRQP